MTCCSLERARDDFLQVEDESDSQSVMSEEVHDIRALEETGKVPNEFNMNRIKSPPVWAFVEWFAMNNVTLTFSLPKEMGTEFDKSF